MALLDGLWASANKAHARGGANQKSDLGKTLLNKNTN